MIIKSYVVAYKENSSQLLSALCNENKDISTGNEEIQSKIKLQGRSLAGNSLTKQDTLTKSWTSFELNLLQLYSLSCKTPTK
jgi:hypothetical protein